MAAMARVTMQQLMKNRRACNLQRHTFSSSFSSSSKMALIESEEELKSAFRKTQEEALPAIFYFTAAWCGPCRLISPILETLIQRHPNLSTYKIDIDKDSLGNMLSQLDITAVPTFHFYQKGKKVDQILGADQKRLKAVMDTLYNNSE